MLQSRFLRYFRVKAPELTIALVVTSCHYSTFNRTVVTGDQKFAGAADSRRMQPDEDEHHVGGVTPRWRQLHRFQPMPQRLNRLLPDAATADLPDHHLDHLVPLTPLLWPHDNLAASPAWPPVARGRFSSTPPVDDLTAPHSAARVGRALADTTAPTAAGPPNS